MGSLNQVRDWSSERSISARKSPLLHNPPGIGFQVADSINMVIVDWLPGFVSTYPMIAIETVGFSLGRARISSFTSAMIVTDLTQIGLSGVV